MSSCPLFIIPPIVLTFQVLNSFRHTMTQSVRGDFYTCVLSSRFVIHINFYPWVSKQTICLNAFYKTLKRLEGIEILSILQASSPTSKNGVLFWHNVRREWRLADTAPSIIQFSLPKNHGAIYIFVTSSRRVKCFLIPTREKFLPEYLCNTFKKWAWDPPVVKIQYLAWSFLTCDIWQFSFFHLNQKSWQQNSLRKTLWMDFLLRVPKKDFFD